MKKKSKLEAIPPERLVTVEHEIANPFDGKRIYCVVADTVQHPLEFTSESKPSVRRTPETRTIQQIAGRAMAQGEHAVSKVRFHMVRDEVVRALRAAKGDRAKVWFRGHHFTFFHEVTTINLAARDSFELYHVLRLLRAKGVPVYSFKDTNPAVYGEGKVLTAIATEPVDPAAVDGVLDYLPLWYRPEAAARPALTASDLK
jgi:hypothetical protein